jgi:gas vesicle protein
MDDDKIINENIFKRSIFKKSTKKEIEDSIEYYITKEEYEKCMVLKNFIDINYYISNPVNSDIKKISQIIIDNKNYLNELNDLDNDIINKIKSIDDIEKLYTFLKTNLEDIMVSILNNDEFRQIYFKKLYEEIINTDMPNIEKQKTKNLIEKYRNETIKYVKSFI